MTRTRLLAGKLMATRTILIVDDEAAIRDMLRVALEMADYECLEASNAQDAHSIIIDHRPDLVLLDWMMPGTSGLELTRRLKQDEVTAKVPIIRSEEHTSELQSRGHLVC